MDEGMRVKEGENTMGNYTREEVLQMAEDEDVEFIRLQFTDMFGTLKKYCDYSSGAPPGTG